MPITPSQARAELARRELLRRGIDPTAQPASVPEKSLMRRAAETVVDSPAIPMAAGIGAGLASLPLSGPMAVGAAGVAAAGAEGWRQVAARSLGLPVPETFQDQTMSMAKEGAINAAGEGLTRSVGPVTRAISNTPAWEAIAASRPGEFIASMGKSAIEGTKGGLSKVVQLITNVDAKEVPRVASEPSAFFNPMRYTKAKQALDEARAAIGVPRELTAEAIDAVKMGQSDALDIVKNVIAGESVDAKTSLQAINALDATRPIPNPKNGALLRRLDQARDVLVGNLQKVAPEERAAASEYAVSQAGKKFRSLLPSTQNKKYALFRTGLMLGGAGAGYRADGIEGALIGGLLTSPVGVGTAVASLGLASRATPAIARGAANIAARGTLGLAKNKTREVNQ